LKGVLTIHASFREQILPPMECGDLFTNQKDLNLRCNNVTTNTFAPQFYS